MSAGGAGTTLDRRHTIDISKNRRMDLAAGIVQRARRPPKRATPRPAMHAGVWRGLAMALALMVGSACAQAEGDATVAEYQIKAAFLLKFLDFVDWPPAAIERADGPFVIGVLGSKTLGDALDRIAAGRRVNGHPVHVRVVSHDESAAGLQMLFVGHAENSRLAGFASATDGQPLLLVAEFESALAQGAMINFIVVDDKVRFDVSLRAAERGGLKISARLLAVARTVLPNTP